MTGFTRHHRSILRRALLISLLLIPALLVGCKNKGSDGSKGPATGAAITGTAQNGIFRLSVNINPNTIALGGSAGITVLATTLNGAPLDNRPVQMATSGGTLDPVAGKTDAAGKFVTKISIEETFNPETASVDVSAIVDGLTATAKLFINVPGTLKIDPAGPLTLAPGDTQFLNCVGGVDPVRWEPSGGTLNRLNERSVIFTAGSLTGTFFVKCTDAANNSASVQITIGTAQTLLTITPAGPVTLRPGQSQTFTASGGRPPYVSWSFPSAAGTLSATSGPTTTLTAGNADGGFTLVLTDSAGATKTATVTIRVETLAISPTEVTVTQLATGAPPGTCGTIAFTRNFVGSGGVLPYTWNVSQPGAMTITPTGPTTATFTFSQSMSGGSSLTGVVTLTDARGVSVTATVTVTCTAST